MVLLHMQTFFINLNFFAMEKKNYVQPEIEVLQIEIEKGFAQSGGAGDSVWDNY